MAVACRRNEARVTRRSIVFIGLLKPSVGYLNHATAAASSAQSDAVTRTPTETIIDAVVPPT